MSSRKLSFGSRMEKQKLVPIDHLQLDPQNARFREDAKDQNEALEFMLDVAGEKCLQLMKNICSAGSLNPTDLPIAVAEGNHYKVLEGNRRLTCLKIWRNPDILDTIRPELRENFKKKFEAVIGKSRYSPPDDLVVVVFDSANDAAEWIDLKHGNGRGGEATVEWNSFEKDRRRYRTAGQRTQTYSFVEKIQQEYEGDSEIEEKLNLLLGRQYTILARVLTNQAFRKVGIIYERNGQTSFDRSAAALRPFLIRLLEDLGEGAQTSRTLGTAADTTRYLEKLYEETLSGEPASADEGCESPKTEDSLAKPKPEIKGRRQAGRNSLKDDTQKSPISKKVQTTNKRKSSTKVFTGLKLDAFSDKIDELVKNTSKLSVENNPVMIAILLRVILDLTCFQFLVSCGKSNDGDLKKRLRRVMKTIDPTVGGPLGRAETADSLNTIYHSLNNNASELTLTQFVVHSSTYATTPSETIVLAERYHPLLEAMNDHLKKETS